MDAPPHPRGAQRLGAGAASLLRCGVQAHPRRAAQAGFITAQFAVVWLVAGAAEVRYGSRAAHLAAGDAFHRIPDAAHDVTFAAGTVSYYLALPGDCLGLLRAMGVPALDEPLLRLGLDRDLGRRWERRIDGLARAPEARLADELLALLALCADLHRRAALAPGRHDAALDRACALLAADLHQRLAMPAIARQVGLAYGTFRSAFTRRFGLGPGIWRIHRRLERAQELLLAGRSIDAIADELGYADRDAFAGDFRRQCGEPPGRWRAAAR